MVIEQICITDIGSTTTKAILLQKEDANWRLAGVEHSPTTVEEPHNDVRIGVFHSIHKLEDQTDCKILAQDADPHNLKFTRITKYLSTSSAGGGLQILVIGLTLADSASSARRASYGAGGVILETFAIDDKKTNVEQMLAMRKLHPDMILLCGGTDGGALSGVIRLAEIIRIANPEPKYNSNERIPLLYAGNKDAVDLIRKIVSSSFDLYILPNLRPIMATENLKPTQDMIQKLFMENVMEHAPGYKELKSQVSRDIIPTPVGVLKSIENLCIEEERNIFAFDIGGATTDVFSYICKHFQRTVSANYGMSYSALNVMKEAGMEQIMRWLPETLQERSVSTYIGNKTLSPTSLPLNDAELAIEHALAREALRMSLEQHREMHYSRAKIGFLDNLKSGTREKFDLQFNFEAYDRTFNFYRSDIDVVLGAGGIFSNCKNPIQAVMILVDALQPKGVTEIWTDKSFITPHLGVFSNLDPEGSTQLLQTDTIQKHAIHIAPIYRVKSKSYLIAELVVNGAETIPIYSNQFYFFKQNTVPASYHLRAKAGVVIDNDNPNYEVSTDQLLIIDTREAMQDANSRYALQVGGYDLSAQVSDPIPLTATTGPSSKLTRRLSLPYAGDILVSTGEKVMADQVVAQNRFMPPRLYVLNTYTSFQGIPVDCLAECITVKQGDLVDIDHRIIHLNQACQNAYKKPRHSVFYSPVRGKVEFINSQTGIVVMSEIQDYARDPVSINVATLLGVKPRQVRAYLKKSIGDFVYRGDILARRVRPVDTKPVPVFVRAPNTGKITNINEFTGVVTIAFTAEPSRYQAHVNGIVHSIEADQTLEMQYSGKKIEVSVGFGSEQHGNLEYISAPEQISSADLQDKILAIPFPLNQNLLGLLKDRRVRAVISPSMYVPELSQFLGTAPGLINTGHEDIPFSILLVNGFGNSQYSRSVDDFLTGARGKLVHIDPHTRIRAGVVRPFLCILEE